MRASCLVLLLLLGTLLTAGERPVLGPETVLGDTRLVPLASSGTPALATDGDELLLVWSGRGSIYAQRLDREGRLATSFPTLLVRGGEQQRASSSAIRAVWAGGLYCIFYSDAVGQLQILRVTRDLEIVDSRTLAKNDSVSDLTIADDQIIVVGYRQMWRLAMDLSVLATESHEPVMRGRTIARSLDGTLILLTAQPPAITARFLDAKGGTVRIASTTSADSVRMIWTGTEYLAVFAACKYGNCGQAMLRLDALLRPKGEPTIFAAGQCYACDINLISLGNDTVLVTWQFTTQNGSNATRVQRFRFGLPIDAGPLDVGGYAATLLTSQGQVVLADALPNVYTITPGTTIGRITATPQAAAEETVAAVASSADAVAVVRRRQSGNNPLNIATILDGDGNVVREVQLRAGTEVALASDGQDFYALVSDYWYSSLQKIEEGAVAVRLPHRVMPLLFWTGEAFLTLQNGWYDGQKQHYTKRFLWFDRSGAPATSVFCRRPVVDLPGNVTLIADGGHTFLATMVSVLRLRRGCPSGPIDPAPDLPTPARLAWQDGTWAALARGADGRSLEITFSSDPTSFTGVRRRITDHAQAAAIAPLNGQWLVASRRSGDASLFVVNERGGVIGTAVLAEHATGDVPPALVPLGSGRLFAIYSRQIHEPPYLGVSRVVIAPVTTEAASRRRGARP